jgi:1,4-alpha-glucan branching enzyme
MCRLFSPEFDYGVPDRGSAAMSPLQRPSCRRGHAGNGGGSAGRRQPASAARDILHVYGIAVIFDVVYNHAGGGFGDEPVLL